jgi:hypothetical protein
MTVRQMVELVQQHHPSMGQTEAIHFLNEALEDFSIQTRMVEGSYTFPTAIDQRYYTLPDNIIEIKQVFYDAGNSKGKRIPRLVGTPDEMDRG